MPLPRTESLAMPEAVPASGRVRNFTVCGHVNMVFGWLKGCDGHTDGNLAILYTTGRIVFSRCILGS